MEELIASEAIYGFAAWLSCREIRTVFSVKDDTAIIADLVKEFCDVNHLIEPRDRWHEKVIHPSEKGVIGLD